MGCIYERLQDGLRCRKATSIWAKQLESVLDLMEHNKFVKAFAEIQSIKENLEEWAPDKFVDNDIKHLAEWERDDHR